jgi:hypothetical protein
LVSVLHVIIVEVENIRRSIRFDNYRDVVEIGDKCKGMEKKGGALI